MSISDLSHDQQNSADYGTGEKNFNIYLIGIGLCIILTLAPYLAVKYSHYSYLKNAAHVYIAAIAQFIIQVMFFLRLNWTTEQSKMNVMSFIFSIIVTLVVVFGSLWIMWNLNYNMMHDMHPSTMENSNGCKQTRSIAECKSTL